MKYTFKNGIIEKSDFTISYKPADYNNTKLQTEKRLKELEAQKIIVDAKADNVARNHPHVTKIDEEKRNAIWLYHENFVAGKQLESAIKSIKKGLKDIKKEMTEIESQTECKF
jgi:prefoldin subunit 5